MIEIPRSPLPLGKSGSEDRPDGYLWRMQQWRGLAIEEALSTLRMHKEYSNMQMYIDMLEGRQWDARRPKHRSGFVNNKLNKARKDKLALLTDIRPTMDISCRVEAYQRQGDIAHDVIRAEWTRQSMDLELVRCVDLAMLGTGYWRMAAEMPGRMRVRACGVDAVLPILPGPDIQDAAAILYRTYKPITYFQQKFGYERSKEIEQYASSTVSGYSGQLFNRPDQIDEITWNALSPQMKFVLGTRSGSGRPPGGQGLFPAVELQEFWVDDPSLNESSQNIRVKDPLLPVEAHNYHYLVRPGQRLFPRKRLIVFAGDKLMYDGPAPFWHGLYPFAKLEFDPVVWGHGGLSTYRQLIPLSKAINEVSAGLIQQVLKAVNPALAYKENAVSPAGIAAFAPDMPGARLRIQGSANPADVRYMDIPQIPAYVFEFLRMLDPEFEKHAGLFDTAALTRKQQVPGADTIEQMRDSMQTQMRLESRRLEAFLVAAGYQAVSNVFQFYTAAQRLRMLGGDGLTWEDFDYDPGQMVPASMPREDHWKLFSINVAPGSLLGASKDRRKQEALTLFKLGAIDVRTLLEIMEWGDIDGILGRLQQQAQVMAAAQQGGGETPRLTRGQRNGGF